MRKRIHDTLRGLAYGDAAGFPSLFHRFHVLPAKRHDFLFNTNRQLSRDRLLPLALPFTHRQAEDTLAPGPTDDTEYCCYTAGVLLSLEEVTLEGIVRAWQRDLVERQDQIWTRFSERAAIDNLARGIMPPASGNDNPLHYEDAGATRAVAIGLYHAGDPLAAADLAALEASISQGEDGIWAAQAVAAAVAGLVGGEEIETAISRAETFFPADSWIRAEAVKAAGARSRAETLPELALYLARDTINNVYSFGNAAPETIPAAFELCRAAEGRIVEAVAAALHIPKAADSLPPLVGALCGAARGVTGLGAAWLDAVESLKGVCLPELKDQNLETIARKLAARTHEGTVR